MNLEDAWTISRVDGVFSSNQYRAWHVVEASIVLSDHTISYNDDNVYPVFYLKNDLSISDSGNGAYNDPFIISE